MKKLFRKFSLFAFFLTILLVSCKKEEPKPEPVPQYRTVKYQIIYHGTNHSRQLDYFDAAGTMQTDYPGYDTIIKMEYMKVGKLAAITATCSSSVPAPGASTSVDLKIFVENQLQASAYNVGVNYAFETCNVTVN
jgi:hypothetical protein